MDGIAEWTRAQRRVIDLMSALDGEQVTRPVPACPDWTMRDLFSHMVGLGTDVVAGDEPDDHNATWTQRQVDERRNRSVAELVSEWESMTVPLQAWMRAHGTRPLGDVTIHEQDLRGTVGVPGGQDTDAMASIRERFVGRFAERLGGLGPVALVGDAWSWVSAGSVDDAEVVVRASDFDLARALTARRSEAQLRGWTERGDVGRYLRAFATLGPLPSTDLCE
jgi:uncharacterized protein (TIGR03083 family)